MGVRRKARECALHMLFEMEMRNETPENVIDLYWEHRGGDEATRKFAERIVQGTCSERARIDALIGKYIENWRLDRLAAVDRNILRLAVYELIGEPDTPRAVVINEAIEIAQKYGSHESGHFVNGVLDGIVKSLAPERAP